MKKKLFLFVVLMGVIFSYTKAYAITGSYEYDNFKYNVKKIHLDIYKSKLDADGNFAGYEDGNPAYVIDVTDDKTITPKYIIDDSQEYGKITMVSLNLNIDKVAMLALVKEKIPTVEKDNHYYVRMVIDYSFESIPSDYKYFYNINYTNRDNDIIFSSETGEDSLASEEFEPGEECSQVFGNFEYKLIGEEGNITYDTTYSEGTPVYMDFMLGSVRFSTVDEKKQPLDDGRKLYVFKFVPFDNIEEYILALNKTDYIQKMEDYVSSKNAQVVEVPDTFMNGNKIIYIVGSIIMLIGCSIVAFTFRKKKI